jgi:RecB family exonuclease
MADPVSRPELAKTILTGDFRSGLESTLLEHLDACASENPLAERPVVVPTNLLKLRLSRELARRTGGHAGIRFMTLKDLAVWAAEPASLDGRAMLPDLADEMILRRLIDGGIARKGYFDRIAERPGLARALLRAIRTLKEASYDPESFAKTAAAAGFPRGGRGNKLAEVARIWQAYEDELRDGDWLDDADLMRAAAESLGSVPVPPPRLVLYGFYDLNALQKRLVAAYSDAGGARVFFPYLEIDSFRYARRTLDWFEGAGFEREPPPGGPPADTRDVPLPPRTVIISAPGEVRETREVVRRLGAILEGEGVGGAGGSSDLDGLGFQDVAVITRTAETYSDLFAEELKLLDAVPYVHAPPPISNTREGRALIALARVVESDFGREEVLEFLNLADLDACVIGTGGVDVPGSDWSKASLLAAITSGVAQWEEKLGRLAARIADAEPESDFAGRHGHLGEPIAALRNAVAMIAARLGDVPGRDGVDSHVDRLASLYEEITVDGPGRAAVLDALGGLRSLAGPAGEITFVRFSELLRNRLGSPIPRERKFGEGGPTVLNVMAARGLPFKVVVVPGLVEKLFPIAPRQDPILLDRERSLLNERRGNDPLGSLPDRTARIDEERLLFRLAVSSATDVLVLSFPRLDPANARPRLASTFVLRTLEAVTGAPCDYETLETSEHVDRVPLSRRFPGSRSQALTRHEFDGCSILSALSSGDVSEIAYLVTDREALPRRLLMERTRWSIPAFTVFDGAVKSEAARRAVADLSGFEAGGRRDGRPVSATALEEYALCPFRFFMHRVLGIEPIEEPEEALELSPKDRGSLYHEVLERFMRAVKAEGGLPLSEGHRARLFELAERIARSGRWSISAYSGAVDLAIRTMRSDLGLWFGRELAEGDEFVPSYFEARFGGGLRPSDDPDLSTEDGIPFEAGGVSLRFGGKIDRIDVSPDGRKARVLDYKTGKAPAGSARTTVLDKGRRLQLPIYLLASRRMLAGVHDGAEVESAEYRYVRERSAGKSTLAFTAALLDEREDDLARAVGLILEGVSKGMFFQFPEDDFCENCDYKDACPSTSTALAAMKVHDRDAEFYTGDPEGLVGIE